MTQMQQPADAAALFKRIRDLIVKPYQIEGHTIVTDISIGISVSPFDAVEADALLRNADMALYGAKGDGLGTFRFFEPEMNTRMKARRELEMDLRKALSARNSSSITSRWSICRPMRSTPSRHCCVGITPSAASSRPRITSRSPRKPA